MSNQHVLILGATSDIGKELAKVYAENKHNILLAGRNYQALERLASDLEIRYSINALAVEFDAINFNDHEGFYNGLEYSPAVVICVFGYLGSDKPDEFDLKDINQIMDVNYKGAVSLLSIAAKDMVNKKIPGTLIGISSVAGDRGRGSNVYYGSAKAGFTTFLSGLRQMLEPKGIHVLTVKPGFVDTKMTQHLDLPKPLTASPDKVARSIFKADLKRKNTIYVLPIWRLIMLVIKLIPEAIFKKLKF